MRALAALRMVWVNCMNLEWTVCIDPDGICPGVVAPHRETTLSQGGGAALLGTQPPTQRRQR